MERPIKVMSNCHCKFCNQDSVDCVAINNKIMNYPYMLKLYTEEEIKNKLDIKIISYMKCMKCNRTFMVEWINELPRPLYYNLFLITLGEEQ